MPGVGQTGILQHIGLIGDACRKKICKSANWQVSCCISLKRVEFLVRWWPRELGSLPNLLFSMWACNKTENAFLTFSFSPHTHFFFFFSVSSLVSSLLKVYRDNGHEIAKITVRHFAISGKKVYISVCYIVTQWRMVHCEGNKSEMKNSNVVQGKPFAVCHDFKFNYVAAIVYGGLIIYQPILFQNIFCMIFIYSKL